MARPGARPIRGALSFLDLRDVPDVAEDFVDDWAATKRPADLIRSHLEARSDFAFVGAVGAALEQALTDCGPRAELAGVFLPDLLTAPSFSSAKTDGETILVRQAVLFQRPADDEFEVLVTLDVEIHKWKSIPGSRERVPASVVSHTVTCEMFDMENDTDLGRVMQEHVRMLRDFPEARQNPRNASTAVTLLGDLATLGPAGTPDTWRSDLELLAQSFDVKASFRREPTFTGTVADSTDHIIRFEPFEGIDPRTHDDTTLPFTAVQARTLTYDQVFHEVALTFADLEEEGDPDPFAQRELTSGERVFHRKVGNGRKFDRFDKGSPSPCVHGTFIVWTKAPKALKGFHRRYSNFQDSWLRHCSRKMNCGMYAAFAPDNL